MPDDRRAAITILGAGLAGLTSSILLSRAGFNITLIEQVANPESHGAGIQISPNGAAVLGKLGIARSLAGIGKPAYELQVYDVDALRPILRVALPSAVSDEASYRIYRRGELVGALLQAATKSGVDLRLGERVDAVVGRSRGYECRLAQGRIHSTPLMVGADGLHSVVRNALNPKEEEWVGNHVAWRSCVPLQGIGHELGETNVLLALGPGKHLVIYPLPSGNLVNIVAVKKLDRFQAVGRSSRDNLDMFKEEFCDFGGIFKLIVRECREATCHVLPRSGIADIWSGKHAVILGDALHPSVPFVAQGGSLALEDAWVLCRELERSPSLEAAARSFRRIRERRVHRVLRRASFQGKLYHLSAGPARLARRLLFTMSTTWFPDFVSSRQNWIYNEDVTRM